MLAFRDEFHSFTIVKLQLRKIFFKTIETEWKTVKLHWLHFGFKSLHIWFSIFKMCSWESCLLMRHQYTQGLIYKNVDFPFRCTVLRRTTFVYIFWRIVCLIAFCLEFYFSIVIKFIIIHKALIAALLLTCYSAIHKLVYTNTNFICY